MHMREYNKLSRYSILGSCVVGLTFPERGFITCIPDEIQWWCLRSPKLNSRKLHRVLAIRRPPASSCRSISILLFFIFPLSFIYVASFLAHHIIFFFAWNCGWLTFQKRDKFNLKRVDGFLLKMLLGSLYIIFLSGLVRISKMRYLWKELSLLTTVCCFMQIL